MNVAVVGIGRIGLPLAVTIASRGHRVTGCDIDAAHVERINRAQNPLPDEAGLGELLARTIADGSFRATTDTAAGVADADVVLFAVRVDVDADGRADLSHLLAAVDNVAAALRPGALCIFDTTLPVGTTRRVLAPRLEAGGRKLGVDLHVAFSPERLLMGRVIEDLTKYPKVVGGIDPEGGRLAAEFYRQTFGGEVLLLSSAEAAELSKLAEGAYRDLNIALANELAMVADVHGLDIAEVIRAANSQPYSHIHVPGTGVGGHCIPVYPRFLMQGEGPSALSALGRAVNDAMPGYVVRRLAALLGGLEGRRVVVLGLTFRPDVAVTFHTNAVDLRRELEALGAVVEGHDPLLTPDGVASLGFQRAAEPLRGYDAAIVHSYHRAYAGLDWAQVAPVIVDARNALDRTAVEAAGVRYLGVGRPPTPAGG
ncbi:nucleotide sugar dehydrogenase [Tepidiforma bonchosmolovskayae]|uniref:Nucleotide sugar dehydrogenase n=1 Tax=Tepidiforma bonchosmolovskayae TaxID=2601677 RepID=A0ABX6BZE8_9CHLR|nr:nucleotide sugar dehydrogenase [Tepidiforma bonchosmolovskayae]QFG02198.1 nucleotide sugar dehydrogenase [Tepidiforma bonchosmolovskayae]